MMTLPVRGASVAVASVGTADSLGEVGADGGAVVVLKPQPATIVSTINAQSARTVPSPLRCAAA